MAMSFRTARNSGIVILLLIIFAESVFAYVIMTQTAERLSGIVTVDQVKLRSWYDVAEIMADAKEKLYDYRLGLSDVVAPVDLLINRAMREIEAIRRLATDEDEISGIEEIVATAQVFKQAVYAYETEAREGNRGSPAAKEMEALAVKTADRVAQLGRGAANYIGQRIADKNTAILKITAFSQSTLGWVLFVAIVATVVNALFMARALQLPIDQLVEGTRKLARGDLTYRVPVESDDKIGQLAQSFNRMALELKKSQNALLGAKKYTENIIRSMINSLIVVNRDAVIKTVNKATCDLLGYKEEELLGKPVAKVFAEGHFDEIGLNDFTKDDFTSSTETTYLAKNGRKIRVLFTGSVVRDEKGRFEGIVCMAQDITLQTEAMRAGHLASLGELAAGVAHEINNPMNSIINFAQILIDELQRGEPVDEILLQKIIKEGDRVSGIVRSLLSFARENERVKNPVSIKDILAETMALTEAQIRKDGINLEVEIPPDLPLFMGDFQQIQQVFINIINNARYALNKRYPGVHPEKRLRIEGCVSTVNGQPYLQTSFFDAGVGIPPHLLDKVMNPFFSTKPAGQGTGLGLAISHGIVTDHAGKIRIDTTEGEFTKVTVLFPALVDAGAANSDSIST